MMKITILSDNTPACGFEAEHGLSMYIENKGKKILVDAGKSSLFVQNAEKLGIKLSKTDVAVLSHSHYDHADGLGTFMELNSNASLYIRREAGEFFYAMHEEGLRYIGPQKGFLKKYRQRIHRVSANLKKLPEYGLILLGHSTPELEAIGDRYELYKESDGKMVPDDFSHEQTVILKTEKGLVIINSCSHAGPVNIINEVEKLGLKDKIYAYIGGFHLIKANDSEILELAEKLKQVSVERIITGHCTGEHAFELLKNELGCKIEQMHAGMIIML